MPPGPPGAVDLTGTTVGTDRIQFRVELVPSGHLVLVNWDLMAGVLAALPRVDVSTPGVTIQEVTPAAEANALEVQR